MKPATPAPAYVAMFVPLTNIARRHGYALAVHGSLQTDMDLVAIPWTDDAATAYDLMEAIRQWACSVMATMFGEQACVNGPEDKPHGRIAWSLSIGGVSVIDLSVMPRKPTIQSTDSLNLQTSN